MTKAEIVDRDFYGIVGYNRLSPYQLPRATPHFLKPGTLKTLCDRDVTSHYSDSRDRAKMLRKSYDALYRQRYGLETVMCERCWKAYHKALGMTAPEQERPGPHRDNETDLPVREIVRIHDGAKPRLPARIVRRFLDFFPRGPHFRIFTYGEHDLIASGRDKGRPKLYHHGHELGVHRMADGKLAGQYAYYDPDREDAASEVRSEIRRLKRQLEEAEQHLLEVYEEEPE